jgi:peroxiredoxin-like protein
MTRCPTTNSSILAGRFVDRANAQCGPLRGGVHTEVQVADHRFSLRLDYAGGVQGTGRLSSAGMETKISVPLEMNGAGVGTNPEELLLGAAASCYAITLSAALSRREVDVLRLEVESECFVEGEGKRLVVKRIVHRPTLVLASGASSEHRAAAEQTARVCEEACMVSSALRGNVEIKVEPTVSVR